MRIENARCDVLLKRASGTGGPLSRLLERVDDHVAAHAPVTCGLR
ncbi:MAG TPA: hypothetical protein VFT24_10330 [Vicinamibacterales bacterium]|nr:hypothetical protein [Vicinamibacterales bacterium]